MPSLVMLFGGCAWEAFSLLEEVEEGVDMGEMSSEVVGSGRKGRRRNYYQDY